MSHINTTDNEGFMTHFVLWLMKGKFKLQFTKSYICG